MSAPDAIDVIEFRESPDALDGLTEDELEGGFFEGWPNPPTPERHLRHLRGCEAVGLAVDEATGDVIGFISVLGDGFSVAFISLLEVLPASRGQGIGTELMRRMLDRLKDRAAIDLVCDEDVVPFYQRVGGTPGPAMLWRRRSVDPL